MSGQCCGSMTAAARAHVWEFTITQAVDGSAAATSWVTSKISTSVASAPPTSAGADRPNKPASRHADKTSGLSRAFSSEKARPPSIKGTRSRALATMSLKPVAAMSVRSVLQLEVAVEVVAGDSFEDQLVDGGVVAGGAGCRGVNVILGRFKVFL